MRKVSHVVKLDYTTFVKNHDGKLIRVLNLYLDENGTESGALVMFEDGKIMSYDSSIWDDIQDCYNYSNWPFVPKSELRDEKLDKILV